MDIPHTLLYLEPANLLSWPSEQCSKIPSKWTQALSQVASGMGGSWGQAMPAMQCMPSRLHQLPTLNPKPWPQSC